MANGLIAAFVAGIALALARHDIPVTFPTPRMPPYRVEGRPRVAGFEVMAVLWPAKGFAVERYEWSRTSRPISSRGGSATSRPISGAGVKGAEPLAAADDRALLA